ncbi:MAG: hypothetical protein QM479_09425 [Pseudomonadota bacterium]
MSKSLFIKYLNRIKDKKLINIKQFIQCAQLNACSETELLKIFSWKKIKATHYQITILNPSLFNQLKSRFQAKSLTPVSNRVQASLLGQSHSQAVSGSMLIVLGYQQNLPQVVICDEKGNYKTTHSLHQHLLVIENLENFLALIKQTHAKRIELLAKWLDAPWPCDIVYAEGNSISNKLHQKFLSQYNIIRCLLDIDLGGLTIFKNIYNLVLPGTQCEFVLSDYFLKKYHQYGHPCSEQQYLQLINYQCPIILQTVYTLLKKNKKFAEQEILLKD